MPPFPKNDDNDYFEPKSVSVSDWNCTPRQTDHWYFLKNQQRTQSQKWNLEWPDRHSHTVKHIEAFTWRRKYVRTENKMHVDTKHKWEKRDSSLDLIFISLQSPIAHVNWVTQLLSVALFAVGQWCHMQCSDHFKLFVNGKFTECFHFPVLPHFPLCLTGVH